MEMLKREMQRVGSYEKKRVQVQCFALRGKRTVLIYVKRDFEDSLVCLRLFGQVGAMRAR